MPQFDFAHVFWPQVSWLAVCFIVLYFGIVGLTVPKLGKVMETREAKVAGDIAAAKLAKASADETEVRYTAELEAAREKSRTQITDAKLHATRASEQRLAVAGEATDGLIHAAEGRIATAVANAEKALHDVVAAAAQDIVARVSGNQPAIETIHDAIKARGGL